MGRLLSARTGQPDDPAPDLAASSLSFCLHELHHLMSRRPPEATLSLRRFLVSKSSPGAICVSSGPALPRPEAEHLTPPHSDVTALKVQRQGNRPCSWGACQLLFLFVVTLGRLGRRVKGHPGRVPRCFASRSSSLRAAART